MIVVPMMRYAGNKRSRQRHTSASSRDMSYPRQLTALLLTVLCVFVPAFCQPTPLSPSQLDQLVSRIALYPDPLLAQILTASTDWSEIPAAADGANQHIYLA